MTKAEKFNLYADTLYGMCRKVQDTVPDVLVGFECKTFESERRGRYRALSIFITKSDEKQKYYDVCEALNSMEENFEAVEKDLNNLLIDVPCPYCDHIEKEGKN